MPTGSKGWRRPWRWHPAARTAWSPAATTVHSSASTSPSSRAAPPRESASDGVVGERTDLERNLRLHLGDVAGTDVAPKARRLLSPRPVPPAPLRDAQRIAVKLGRLDWESAW